MHAVRTAPASAIFPSQRTTIARSMARWRFENTCGLVTDTAGERFVADLSGFRRWTGRAVEDLASSSDVDLLSGRKCVVHLDAEITDVLSSCGGQVSEPADQNDMTTASHALPLGTHATVTHWLAASSSSRRRWERASARV
jgi:hypothetical protein